MPRRPRQLCCGDEQVPLLLARPLAQRHRLSPPSAPTYQYPQGGSGKLVFFNGLLGKIWLYDTTSGSFTEVAASNAGFFQSGAPGFLTQDEEASGIIDAKDLLGPGWFLMDVQAHYSIPGELAEGGQLLAMFVDPRITMPVGVDAFGASSPGCNGPVLVSGQSIPRAGNATFAIGCVNAPLSSAGVAVITFDALASPLPVLGINLWVNPTTILATPVVVSDAQGRGSLALPIPTDVLPGTQVFDQFIWIGPNAPAPCPPTGVSASNGVRITIQS